MERVNKQMGRGQRPYIIELVGLAGAGKSTLAHALSQRNKNMRVDDDLELKKKAHMPIFASCAPTLLPFILRPSLQSRGFTWNEIKAMAYLKGWPRYLRHSSGDTIILLDHGPIFKMATLNAFGPANLQSQKFNQWWHTTLTQWASTLDMIIWLYAPQKTLLARINTRKQRHAVKGKNEQEAAQFLRRYQVSYDQILSKLATYGGPRQLQFDTSQVTIEQIVNETTLYLF